METSPYHPVMIPAKTTILLVFVPTVPSWDTVQEPSLPALIDVMQRQLGTSVPILMLNETLHADVILSFHVHQLPAFVLVQQGVELWRHEGMLDQDTRANLTDWLLNS